MAAPERHGVPPADGPLRRLALALDTLLAALRVSPVPLLRSFAAGYVEGFRNVPTAVAFFFTLFALPQRAFASASSPLRSWR